LSAPAVQGLYVLADDDPRWRRDPVEQARAALAGGAAAVQLRAKHATDRQALAWAEAIVALCRAAGARSFVNDRFDLALAAGADGVHLGQDDLPPDRMPAAARARLLVGRSTHTSSRRAPPRPSRWTTWRSGRCSARRRRTRPTTPAASPRWRRWRGSWRRGRASRSAGSTRRERRTACAPAPPRCA
jgi:hypothetical protein